MRVYQLVGVVLLGSFALVATGISLVLSEYAGGSPADIAPDLAALTVGPGAAPAGATPRAVYAPPQPRDAPAGMRDEVEAGHRFVEARGPTGLPGQKAALGCGNCHFDGGITAGGINGGISLVGASVRYPTAGEHGGLVTLGERVNECVTANLHADALEDGGDDMKRTLAYIQWISRGIPVYVEVPWLELSPLDSSHEGDAKAGSSLFARECAGCHGQGGGGTPMAPPVWGDRSFTKRSEMNDRSVLATFIHRNMPRQNPTLTVEQALDAAAFVSSQPRP